MDAASCCTSSRHLIGRRRAPGNGYLYDLEVQLVRWDTIVDSYHQSVGVRTVKVDGIRFLINGEPF
ncbi:MAG TPA: hypothetical protein VK499_12495, partial [Propionibacteriaceae bacterium]|nr:hypothetical protein [Propionibacteriaceae bacterium]